MVFMVKKTMNSLFLNYLLQSQDNIEANIEKWTKDFNIAAVQKALDEAQLLFDSLMQEYFG